MNKQKPFIPFVLVKQNGNWVKFILSRPTDIDVQAHVIEEPKKLEQH